MGISGQCQPTGSGTDRLHRHGFRRRFCTTVPGGRLVGVAGGSYSSPGRDEARREAELLRQALEDRKLVERAKGAVMKRLGVGEEEAYLRMKRARQQPEPKADRVAKELLAAEEVFRTMGGG
jgi:hypothetical protein